MIFDTLLLPALPMEQTQISTIQKEVYDGKAKVVDNKATNIFDYDRM